MFTVKLKTNANPNPRGSTTAASDPLGRTRIHLGYEPSWIIDDDDIDFILEVAAAELDMLDVLSVEICYGTSIKSRSLKLTFGTLLPYLAKLGAFLIEPSSEYLYIELYEDDAAVTFYFDEGNLITKTKPSLFQESPLLYVVEKTPLRLIRQVTESLKTFVDTVESTLPYLHQRDEYQTWRASREVQMCLDRASSGVGSH